MLSLCCTLGAQEGPLTQIEGTDLHLQLPPGYALIDDTPGIMNDLVSITFMQMGEISYYDNIADFADIEAGYAEEGILVKDRRDGKLSQYDAIIIEIESEPQISQAFFGNDDFCALIQIIGSTDTTFSTKEVISDLNTLVWQPSGLSALEEHALFNLGEGVSKEWIFQGFNIGNFIFEHPASGDAILLFQLPAASLGGNTPKELAQQFLDKYSENGMVVNILFEDVPTIASTPAHRYIIELSSAAELENSFLYLVAFGGDTAACVFNGLGEKDTPERRARFEVFLEQISFPEE